MDGLVDVDAPKLNAWVDRRIAERSKAAYREVRAHSLNRVAAQAHMLATECPWHGVEL